MDPLTPDEAKALGTAIGIVVGALIVVLTLLLLA